MYSLYGNLLLQTSSSVELNFRIEDTRRCINQIEPNYFSTISLSDCISDSDHYSAYLLYLSSMIIDLVKVFKMINKAIVTLDDFHHFNWQLVALSCATCRLLGRVILTSMNRKQLTTFWAINHFQNLGLSEKCDLVIWQNGLRYLKVIFMYQEVYNVADNIH